MPPRSPHVPSQAPSDPSTGTGGARPRGLGPFSSNQLTAIIVTALLAFGIPVGATAAASVMKVQITSPNGGQRVQVTDGRLLVQAPWPELLTTQVAPPSTFVNTTRVSVTNITCTPVVVAPSARALIVTSVRMNVFANPSPGTGNGIYFYVGDEECKAEKVATVNPGGLGPQELTFDPGLAVPKGTGLYAQAGGGVDADVFVGGYTIAATSVPASVPTPSVGATNVPNQPRQN